MNSIEQKPHCLRRSLWTVFAFVALVVWPSLSHWAWLNWDWLKFMWPLHGRPAFFLGLLVFLIVVTVATLATGAFRQGWRWLLSRQAAGRLLTSLVLALSVVALFYSVESWCGKRTWARVLAEATQRGLSLNAMSLQPAPVPAEQDFARAPLFAPLFEAVAITRNALGDRVEPNLGPLTNVLRLGAQLTRHHHSLMLAPWMEGQTTDLTPWLNACLMLDDAKSKTTETNRQAVAEAILQALAPFDKMIEELRSYSERPHCQLPFDCDLAYFSEFYPERTMLSFMRILRLRATAQLALDHNEAAFRDVYLTLRLAWHLRHLPTLYYQQDRTLCFVDGLQPFWEGWVARRWTAVQLELLQRQLGEFSPLVDYANQTRFVAYANAAFIESVIPTSALKNDPIGRLHPAGRQGLRWIRRIYPVGWSLQDQAAIWSFGLRQEAALGTDSILPLPPKLERRLLLDFLHATSDPFFPVYFAPRLAMMFDDLREYPSFSKTAAYLATLACALERFRLAQGDYPEALQSLVPAFIARVPSDPMSGADFRYRQLPAEGFVLYSVGANKVDDHGQYAPRRLRWDGKPDPEPDMRHGDWVWTTVPTSARLRP